MKREWEGVTLLHDTYLGGVTVEFDDAQLFRPANTHLFCCRCGTVWGKLLFPLSSHHHVTNIPCEHHGGGVFDHRWPGRFTCKFAEKVLMHDFCIMYEWLDKKQLPEVMQDGGSMHQTVGVGSWK